MLRNARRVGDLTELGSFERNRNGIQSNQIANIATVFDAFIALLIRSVNAAPSHISLDGICQIAVLQLPRWGNTIMSTSNLNLIFSPWKLVFFWTYTPTTLPVDLDLLKSFPSYT